MVNNIFLTLPMKSHALPVLLFVAIAVTATPPLHADEFPESLFGTWVGRRSEFIDGQRFDGTQKVRFRPRRDGGAFVQSVIVFPGLGKIVSRGVNLGNGRMFGSASFRGTTISTSTGRWSYRGGIVRARVTIRDIVVGTYRSNISYRPSKRRLAVVSTSKAGTVSVTLKKRGK
jgi:hypothetical protein